MLAAALAYVERGWPVFPIIPNGKRPLFKSVHAEGDPLRETCKGACGQIGHGLYDATTDIELVSRWLTTCPNANLAVPTGLATFDVLDVDVKPKGAGWPAFNRLKAEGLLPEPFMVVQTPSGGLHAGYAGTDQACASLVQHFIDFKSTGGYVVVPPSVVDGKPYRLISERPHARNQLSWSSVREFLDPPKPVQATLKRASNGTGIDHLAVYLAGKRRPGRNAALFWAACRAVENGASEAELHALYRDMDFDRHFDERQAARTVADAFRRATRRSA
ncbi:bifunctional DNA primase/polymerase [Nonomuraea sp. LPB2021202275-12-8]|uniref:bifunctional DNA primase/polymerase n=1 Tax=Nonomuraea sp. LPB2021202275-12-8 TaxID=3120159 RepID=UPI00300DB3A0